MSPFVSPNPVLESEIISGERLQALADVSVITRDKKARHRSLPAMPLAEFGDDLAPEPGPLAALRDAGSIFVYADMISPFFENIVPRLERPVVLVTHNGDANIDERYRHYADNPKIAHWFAQNVVLNHPKLTAIPIGIANGQWPHGDVKAVVEAAANSAGTPKQAGLYVNFETKTNLAKREPILAALRTKPYAVMGRRAVAPSSLASLASRISGRSVPPRDRPLPYRDYLRELAQWIFCVSPPGNGLDCHRTWEALYLGVVPVLAAPVLGLLDGLPHLVVDDFERLALADLEAMLTMLAPATGSERLRLSYWRDRIRGAVSR